MRVGKLNLVDLAGSERQGKAQTSGERFKEATKINLSLSALSGVISALTDRSAGVALCLPSAEHLRPCFTQWSPHSRRHAAVVRLSTLQHLWRSLGCPSQQHLFT